ncbi:hypothetical protein RRG08_052320 [Elysia crispata]|uniref:Uncharacterized protein n=1 Tax=Elysia crispata TaxID=231223 RepID=A0AAE1AID1_9GAST|nr:hypothetical protein RRG08_052320 [Elysia crispata]
MADALTPQPPVTLARRAAAVVSSPRYTPERNTSTPKKSGKLFTRSQVVVGPTARVPDAIRDTEDLMNDTGELMCGLAASAYFGALLLRRTQELIIDFNAYTEKSFGFESSETSKLQLRLGIKVNIFNQI